MFDGINSDARIVPSRFDQPRNLITRAAPEAEEVREQMEIRHASFLLKNALVLQDALKSGSGVEDWEHLFLTRIFDTRLADAQFASNIQVNY